MEQQHCHIVNTGARHWGIFTELCRKANLRGGRIQDAWWAAMAIEAGCYWITLDSDFDKFPGLRWRRPLED